MLRLVTFGGLELSLNDRRIEDRLPAKAAAMVVYMADQGGQVRRTTMAGLLWSDVPEERARANLRVVLSRLRSETGNLAQGDREWIVLAEPVELDATRLLGASAHDVADVYRGDFLAGVELPGAELFNQWAEARRADLQATATRRLFDAATDALEANDWEVCEQFARNAILIDPWNEPAHQMAIAAIGAQHGRGPATAYLERYRVGLEREVGRQPHPSTIAAVESIVGPATTAKLPGPLPDQALPPTWATRVFGRDDDLAHLVTLAQPGRPVAIVGPGGVGKSRLLSEFAMSQHKSGRAVAYIPFDGVAPTTAQETPRLFAETILVALGLPADSELGPLESVMRRLRTSSLVLCLDNVEQLADIETQLADLQHKCPQLTIVATSRRRPELMNARVLSLSGLALEAEPPRCSPAARLFVDRLGRADLNADDMHLVDEICSSLAGHPLAMELAAHRATTMPLAELATFVKSMEPHVTLESRAPDLADRHRSLDVLVQASVDQLSKNAGAALQASAMFAGPFHREDVEAIQPTAGPYLAELVDHSLLLVDGPLYQMHPVVRRFERQQMLARGGEQELSLRHARRMIDVMRAIENPLSSGVRFQRRAGDLRSAIDWMIDHAPADEITEPLAMFLGFQRSWGWFESSQSTITRALERADLAPVTRAELHRHRAEALLHAGLHVEAASELEQGIEFVGEGIPGSRWGRIRWNSAQIGALVGAPLRITSFAGRAEAAERARLMSLLGEVFYVSDRRGDMASYGLGSLSAGRLSRDPTLRTAGDAAISIASQLAGAHTISERYRKRARRRSRHGESNPFTAAEAWGITAVVAVGAGAWSDARVDCAIAIDAAARSGRTRMISQLEILTALVDYHEEKYGDGLGRMQSVHASIEQTGFKRALTWVHATTAELALASHDYGRADDAATRALESALSWGRPEDEARAHVARARLLLYQDDQRSASNEMQRSLLGLQSPSAFSIQHFELHCSAAECATELMEAGSPQLGRVAAETTARLRKYAKAFPIARPRLVQLQESPRGSSSSPI